MSTSMRPRFVTSAIEPSQFAAVLARLSGDDVVAWVRHGQGLVGWGEAARLQIPPGIDRFTAAQQAFRAFLRETGYAGAPTDLVGFGSFTFDPQAPGSVLVVPRTVVGYRDGQAWVTSLDDPRQALAALPSIDTAGQSVQFRPGTLSPEAWADAVDLAVKSIKAGNMDKVVLARDVVATATEPFALGPVLRYLADHYGDCYTFACAGLVGATPELLVRRSGGRVESLLLAGSQRRGTSASEDAELGTGLLASHKNADEHRLAVRSLRDALTPLCTQLAMDANPSLLRLSNVQHLATHAYGQLANPATTALDVVAALHPTGAVCGSPTPTALETIRTLEGMNRGRYAGPVGWIDANGDGEWGIALRCAAIDGATARLYAGCGIVAESRPAAELAETELKLDPMRRALSTSA